MNGFERSRGMFKKPNESGRSSEHRFVATLPHHLPPVLYGERVAEGLDTVLLLQGHTGIGLLPVLFFMEVDRIKFYTFR